MGIYEKTYTKPYPDGWKNRPDKTTPIMAEILDGYDVTLEAIEEELVKHYSTFLLDDMAAWYIGLDLDSTNYVMTLQLKSKDGTVLDTKTVDFPVESMVIGASYETGILTLTLQNGQELQVPLLDIVDGLVKDTLTIAGIDLQDDITKEELIEALDIQEPAPSGSSIVDITQEEYDELTNEEKQEGTIYNITDAPPVISEEYDPEKEYVPGNYCMYKNGLYKCMDSATGGWDADCWQKTTVTGELEALYALLAGGVE